MNPLQVERLQNMELAPAWMNALRDLVEPAESYVAEKMGNRFKNLDTNADNFVKRQLSPREIDDINRDRSLMEGAPPATAQDLNELGLGSQGGMTPNTFGPKSAWEALENLQPSGSTAPNPSRSPQWLNDIANQKMREDQITKELEQQIRQQQPNSGNNPFNQIWGGSGIQDPRREGGMSRQNHPLNKFRNMLFPE